MKLNKKHLTSLLTLQTLFFILLFMTGLSFLPNILTPMDNIFNYLSEQSPDNMLGDDPLMLHENYEIISANITFMLLIILVIFLLIESYNYYLASLIVYKKKFNLKGSITYLGRFSLVSVIFFLLIANFFYHSIKDYITLLGESKFDFVAFFITLILLYFYFIFVSLIYDNKLKVLPRKALSLGIKRFFKILLYYLLILMILLSLFLLISFLIEGNLFLVSFLIIIFILSFAYSKIFFIKKIRRLCKKIKY